MICRHNIKVKKNINLKMIKIKLLIFDKGKNVFDIIKISFDRAWHEFAVFKLVTQLTNPDYS